MKPLFQAIENIVVYDLRGTTHDVQLAVSTCVGILNRPQPRIYLIFAEQDEYWLKHLFSSIPQTLAEPTGNAVLATLLDHYSANVQGLIIYDPKLIDTINVATTLAGLYDGIVVSPTLAQDLQSSYSLPILFDLQTYHWRNRLQASIWAQQHLLSRCSSHFLAGMRPEITGGLRSFLVATRTFVYWLDTSNYLPDLHLGLLSEHTLAHMIYHYFAPGAIHLGWFINEPSGVAMTSRAGMAVIASDYFNNLEVWSAMNRTEAMNRVSTLNYQPGTGFGGIVASARPEAGKIYLSFTMSEGDNLQYCQDHMLRLWQDQARGSVPIGWTIAPVLLEAAPALAQYYRDTASENDELIAGPSGAAYLFPSYYPADALPSFLQRTGEMMQAMSMTTLAILDSDPLYSSALPLLSKISMTGMALKNDALQKEFAHHLRPYGVRGILNGSGLHVNIIPSWSIIDGLPIYRSLGPIASIAGLRRLIKFATQMTRHRPLFLNIYCIAWSISPTDIQQIRQQLDERYEFVLPSTLLAMLET